MMKYILNLANGQQFKGKNLDEVLRKSGLHTASGRLTKSQALDRILRNNGMLFQLDSKRDWQQIKSAKDFQSGGQTGTRQEKELIQQEGGGSSAESKDGQQKQQPMTITEQVKQELKQSPEDKKSKMDELKEESAVMQNAKESSEEDMKKSTEEREEKMSKKKQLEEAGLWDDEEMKPLTQKIQNSISELSDEIDRHSDMVDHYAQRIQEIEQEIRELADAPEEQPSGVVVGERQEHPMQSRLIRKCKAVQMAQSSNQDALYPMLVGPAGSGKTTAARNVSLTLFGDDAIAEGKFGMLSLNEESEKSEGFGFISPIDKMYKSTDFRRIYENGGVFLLDEIDASNANTLTSLNAAISAPYASFPDKVVARHKDFVLIAAANTFGNGADGLYVGRNELDAASRDRFSTMVWNYDWDGVRAARPKHKAVVTLIESLSKAALKLEMQHIISPRAALFAPYLLESGDTMWDVLQDCVFKGLPNDDQRTLIQEAELSITELRNM